MNGFGRRCDGRLTEQVLLQASLHLFLPQFPSLVHEWPVDLDGIGDVASVIREVRFLHVVPVLLDPFGDLLAVEEMEKQEKISIFKDSKRMRRNTSWYFKYLLCDSLVGGLAFALFVVQRLVSRCSWRHAVPHHPDVVDDLSQVHEVGREVQLKNIRQVLIL